MSEVTPKPPTSFKGYTLKVYLGEFENQLHFAKVCYADYLRSKHYEDPNKYVFMHAHHFLSHCANIAKLLYPEVREKNPGKELEIKRWRSTVLSNIFGREQKDKLKNLVKVRNDLEHFDERIDEWVLGSKRHNFVDMNINDRGPLSIAGVDGRDFFRNLEGGALTFAGRNYNLDELYNLVLSLEAQLHDREALARAVEGELVK